MRAAKQALRLLSMGLLAIGLGACAAEPGGIAPALEGDEAIDEARVASWERFVGAWSVTQGPYAGIVFTNADEPGRAHRFFADRVVQCVRAPCPPVREEGSFRATSDYLYLTTGDTTERYSWTLRGETLTLRVGRRVVHVLQRATSYCTQADDCTEQRLVGLRCVGRWTCNAGGVNACQYRCGTSGGGATGTACRSNDQCARGQFCAFASGNRCGGTGTCTARPDACTAQFSPVCGCDGRTYGNACSAASAGVSVASNGECPLAPGECRDNSDCTGGAQYCRKSSCGDARGTCATITVRCSNAEEPVCGCDGVTYRNACMALTAGQNVASQGACR